MTILSEIGKKGGDTLILIYDTINYPKSRYKGINKYLIKRNKLTNLLSNLKNDQIQRIGNTELKKEGMTDSLKIGSYSKFKRNCWKNICKFPRQNEETVLYKT